MIFSGPRGGARPCHSWPLPASPALSGTPCAPSSRGPLKFSRTALESGAAGFVGLLFKLVCDEMHASEQWTGVVVGLAGWLGASASVGVLEEFVYKRLGVNRPGKGEPHDGLDH